MQKTVAVVTGTRAEYGLLRPVIEKIAASERLRLRLVVTGAHLSERFGNTVQEIEQSGVPIDRRIPILTHPSTPLGSCKTVADTIGYFSDYFEETRPDAVLVLGDRYEIFAVASAAAMLHIPVAHISGGDVTLGAADEFFRHSITKMASLHFPSCAQYANRLVAMGEEPRRVFNVGGLGDENIRTLKLKDKAQLAQDIGFSLDEPYLLVTYHPETAGKANPVAQVQQLLDALDTLPQLRVIFTLANADAGGEAINETLRNYVAQHSNAIAFTSMGMLNYLSAMRTTAAVVGNSSSGVVEAPSFGVPTVNIGERQAGRLRCPSILDCAGDTAAIRAALVTALSPEFAAKAKAQQSPYYNGTATSSEIVRILSEFLFSDLAQQTKTFFDAPLAEHYFD